MTQLLGSHTYATARGALVALKNWQGTTTGNVNVQLQHCNLEGCKRVPGETRATRQYLIPECCIGSMPSAGLEGGN